MCSLWQWQSLKSFQKHQIGHSWGKIVVRFHFFSAMMITGVPCKCLRSFVLADSKAGPRCCASSGTRGPFSCFLLHRGWLLMGSSACHHLDKEAYIKVKSVRQTDNVFCWLSLLPDVIFFLHIFLSDHRRWKKLMQNLYLLII